MSAAHCAQGQLFQALRTNRLIPADTSWQDIRYSRCGRTDKGVSGLGQVECCTLVTFALLAAGGVSMLACWFVMQASQPCKAPLGRFCSQRETEAQVFKDSSVYLAVLTWIGHGCLYIHTWLHHYPFGETADHAQVLAMVLRSGAKQGQVLPAPADEIDYCTRLNRALPHDIRILGWTDVADDFHARCVWVLSGILGNYLRT